MDAKACKGCQAKPANWFCACTEVESLFCDECLLKHSRIVLRQGHHPWPISALPGYKNPRYFDRQDALQAVQSQVLTSLDEVDQAIVELTTKVEEWKTTLTAWCREKVTELEQLKAELGRDVEKALTEVEDSIAEEQPRLTSYAALFRDIVEKPRSIQLFTYQLESSQMPLKITFSKTKPQACLQVPVLPAQQSEHTESFEHVASVCYDTLTLYNLSSQETSQHRLSTNFKGGGSFIELDQKLLLCLGSKPASAAALALDLTTFRLTPLKSLSEAREAPGVAKDEAFVYVFGGMDKSGRSQNSCEKWSLAGGIWSSAGSMKNPRAYFTPCQHQACWYLLTTLSQSTLEVFRPDTGTFTELEIQLPRQLRFGWRSVAFVARGELCVLTEGEQMARWKIDSREFQVHPTKRACWSTQPPRSEGGRVLIAYDGQVVKFSLETFSFIA